MKIILEFLFLFFRSFIQLSPHKIKTEFQKILLLFSKFIRIFFFINSVTKC